MDRRNFLKGMAGAGALIATADLPAFASPEETAPVEDIFTRRGKYERLSLSYATVEIGLAQPFSVLHISDTHLTAAYPDETETDLKWNKRRTTTFGGHQEEALRDTLAWAKDHVEYIVHTGDIIDWQSRANFDLVRKHFGADLIGAVGNHEYKVSDRKYEKSEAYKDPTRKLLQKNMPFPILIASQIVHEVNFITLDNVFGTVVPEQVKRFKKEAKKGFPIVLCTHVPLFTDKIYREHRRFWSKKGGPLTNGAVPTVTGDYLSQKEDPVTAEFIAYLKEEPLLKCILTGHMHISTEDQFSPTCREYAVAGNFLWHGREVLFV